jgi:hypothetical protein
MLLLHSLGDNLGRAFARGPRSSTDDACGELKSDPAVGNQNRGGSVQTLYLRQCGSPGTMLGMPATLRERGGAAGFKSATDRLTRSGAIPHKKSISGTAALAQRGPFSLMRRGIHRLKDRLRADARRGEATRIKPAMSARQLDSAVRQYPTLHLVVCMRLKQPRFSGMLLTRLLARTRHRLRLRVTARE